MPLEENVVERNVFNTNGFRITDDLEHAIDQQHRIPKWEEELDLTDINRGTRTREQALARARDLLFEESLGQQMIQLVPALVSDKSSANRPAAEVKVADQVQHLMARALVGKAEAVVDRPVAADH